MIHVLVAQMIVANAVLLTIAQNVIMALELFLKTG